MASIRELQPFISEPREALGVEYKDWLDLSTKEHKATLAKAAIALANHGGGFIVIGFADQGSELQSQARPSDVQEITQDAVNAAIRRYATPEFHCRVDYVAHQKTNVVHPVITVPGNLTVPVMSKGGCENVIAQNRCYIRKPGPRSEEPQTSEEWRELINRCIRAGREDMLEAIRSIVSGRVEILNPAPNALDELRAYCDEAREHWKELVAKEPKNSPARFPYGYYEMGFFLVGAQPSNSLTEIKNRLAIARNILLTGWPPFSEIYPGLTAKPYNNFVEAWVGRPVHDDSMEREPAHCDFWRVSTDGKLYTIRGYFEDGARLIPGGDRIPSGEVLDVTLPVWKIAEGLLFANRFAERFDEVDAIAIQCRFTGLNGRRLTYINGVRFLPNHYISGTDEITLTRPVTPQQVRDNLAEILHSLLLPLYEYFQFFQLPFDLVKEELGKLLKRNL